jgi:hypothetical protein
MRTPLLVALVITAGVALASAVLAAAAGENSRASARQAQSTIASQRHALPPGRVFMTAQSAMPRHKHAGPSDGVYTCSWIAAHPVQAAEALVSCDPRWRPDFVPPESPETYAHCHWIPSGSERVGQGVFTWSHYEYAHYYDISATWGGYYTWYVQKTDGTNQHSELIGPNDFTFHYWTPAGNVRRSGAQNHSQTPDNYYTCFDLI